MSHSASALTIVFGFRDRDITRVVRCLTSLQKQTFQDFAVHLVDYGSTPAASNALSRAASSFPFCRTIRTETRGYPWNRAQALNIGGRLARTEYVMTTDADMVFPCGFLSAIMARASAGNVLYCYPHLLPEAFDDWENLDAYHGTLPTAARDARGGCQLLATGVYHRIRGFDEYYQYWGVEDRDMHQRLMRLGLAEVLMNERVAMYHQWHPPANVKTRGFMPSGHWARMQSHYYAYADKIERNDETWGSVLTAGDRPVFRHLDFDAMSLVPSDDLVMFDGRAYDERDAGRFVCDFWELPPGHAMVVEGAYLPMRRQIVDRAIGAANRLLRRSGFPSQVAYASNTLHAGVAEFLAHNRRLVRDYYLDFPVRDGCSLFVRA